jgi:MoxR-like ATPase
VFTDKIDSIDAVIGGLGQSGYIASRRIATALYLAKSLQKPILVEGSAGVGKTELALATAEWLGVPLVRMQCYEGLDESKALYEWKYGKQMLYTQILKDKMGELLAGEATLPGAMTRLAEFDDLFFSPQFLEPRPLLKALQAPLGAVLLIDEVDKADEEFEAFLLELLSAYQISIPEIGTVRAVVPPLVFLTSNNMREMGDALKRRCLHLYIPLPDAGLERQIVATRVPDIEEKLNRQLVAFVQLVRGKELKKLPSIAETIDWARTLMLMHASSLDVELVRETLNVLLKFEQDIEAIQPDIPDLARKAIAAHGV